MKVVVEGVERGGAKGLGCSFGQSHLADVNVGSTYVMARKRRKLGRKNGHNYSQMPQATRLLI